MGLLALMLLSSGCIAGLLSQTPRGMIVETDVSGQPQWQALSGKMIRAYRAGEYQAAMLWAKTVYDYSIAYLGTHDAATWVSANNLILLYELQGAPTDAEPVAAAVLKIALAFRESTLSPESQFRPYSLRELANIYLDVGQTSEASRILRAAWKVREQGLGGAHLETLYAQGELAAFYLAQQQPDAAEPLLKTISSRLEKVLGAEHLDRLAVTYRLARLYYRQARYEEAIPLLEEVSRLREKVLGTTVPETLVPLQELGMAYTALARHTEQVALYEQLLPINETVLGQEHRETLIARNHLAVGYRVLERGVEAIPLYEACVVSNEKVFGPDHPFVLDGLHHLAILYKQEKQDEKAIPVYLAAIKQSERVKGEAAPLTLNLLYDLATLYRLQHRQDEAASYYRQFVERGYLPLGQGDLKLVTALNHLAAAYDELGQQSLAVGLYAKLVLENDTVLGSSDPLTLTALNRLAALYDQQGQQAEAIVLYQQAVERNERALGIDHPWTMQALDRLLFLLLAAGEDERAAPVYRATLTLKETILGAVALETLILHDQYLLFLGQQGDFSQMAAHLKTQEARFLSPEFQDRCKSLNPLISPERTAYATLMTHFQAMALSLAIHWESEYYQQWLANLIFRWKGVVVSKEVANPTVRLAEVGKGLASGSGLLEFLFFTPIDFATGQPIANPRLVAYLRLADQEGGQLYWHEFGDLGTAFSDMAEAGGFAQLYSLLLAPFEAALQPLERVYLASDQALHLVPFVALSIPEGGYLVQRQQVHSLLLGRDLLQPKASPATANWFLGLGGLEYSEGAEFPPLYKSLSEAWRIARIFKTNHRQGEVIVYSEQDGNEHRLKSLPQPPRILQFSTHAFYRASGPVEYLAGVALARANRGLQGKLDYHHEDGVLYVDEVVGLNLTGTQLVALPTCRLEAGQVDYAAGVTALARGFQQAGAKAVLMRLQPITDYRAARAFMETFYRIWLDKKTAAQVSPAAALHQARLTFINHPEKEKYRQPAVWAPYLLISP